MKAVRLPSGSTYYAHEHNALVNDASSAASLLVHQKLGALALATTPTNGQTVTFDVNGTNVVFTAVTGTPTNPGDVKAPGTAIGYIANLEAALQNPTVSTSTFVALSAANAQLINFLGWSLPVGTTTITPFSLNTTTYAPLTSFTASTTVTSGTYTASTMQLYVEPGTYYIGIVKVVYAGGATTTFTAPATHPRIDIVTLDSSGTLAVTTGTEASSPVAPTYPANKLVLCEVTHSVGETSIFDNANQTSGQGFISNDSRNFLAPPYISDPSQVATQIFIPWISSPAQGDVPYFDGSNWNRLPAGTSGFVLQTKGASANPVWAAATPLAIGNNTDTTATSADTTIFSLTIPGLSANGIIKVEWLIDNNNGGGVTANDQYGLKAGVTDLLRLTQAASVANNLSIWGTAYIANQNSVSSQRTNGVYYDNGSASGGRASSINSVTSAVNLGSSWTMSFFYKKATGTEAMRGLLLTATVLVA